MESPITLSALQSRWAVVGSLAIVGYDYFLTLDREIQYIWKRKISSASVIYIVIRYSSLASNVLTLLNFFSWPGKSTPKYARRRSLVIAIIVCSAVFSSLRAHALCQRKIISYLILALGVGNAVPSVYGAIMTRASYNPGPDNINAMCNMDFSRFTVFRNALLVVNVMNLAFIDNLQLLFLLIDALTVTTVILTCRFVLDLFEASAIAPAGSRPTVRLSTVPTSRPTRPLAPRHVDGPGPTSSSRGIFDSRRRMEDSESVYSTTDDYDFELQPVSSKGRKSNVRPLVSEP
ncbi:uncharacterized protein BXZ73DRAFT_98090 [Epithele typhae]|uniref:uncharacterized protein n=1 Tax=Epithele typhae TaxID=378194 RepID=UPI0020089DF8|nr:uncharacterized protein BXZ73DRAFT_98090 [Epithele typhae]KAH9941699.1 hypothetical protein BXZ73DRAFT_98090 [Epithele typhae]